MPRVFDGEICGAAVWNPHLLPQIPRRSVNLVFEFGASVLTVKKASQGECWKSETQEKAGFSKKEKEKKSRYYVGTSELSFIHVSPLHDSDGPLLVLSTSNTRVPPSTLLKYVWISSVMAWTHHRPIWRETGDHPANTT